MDGFWSGARTWRASTSSCRQAKTPLSTMKPTLMEFVRIYLKVEVRGIERAQTPRQFRHDALGIMRSPSHDFSVFAEVAA